MSLLEPRGPLPPRVYWTRRLVLLSLVVGVIAVVGSLVAGGGGGQDAAASDGSDVVPAPTSPSTTAPSIPPAGSNSGGTVGVDSGHGEGSPGDSRGHESGDARTDGPGVPRATEQSRPPLVQPTGPCDPSDVTLAVDVSDSKAGEPNTATLSFRSGSMAACTLGITPDTVEIHVTSGDVVLWASDDCPSEVAARQVVPRRDPPATYEFTWSGYASTRTCGRGEAAQPGGYWVEASVVGGEPTRAYFDVT